MIMRAVQNRILFSTYTSNSQYNAKVTVNDSNNGGTTYDNVIVHVGDAIFQGFGEHTTGGKGYNEYTVNNALELEETLQVVRNQGGFGLINLNGEWTYNSNIILNGLNNMTIMGLVHRSCLRT